MSSSSDKVRTVLAGDPLLTCMCDDLLSLETRSSKLISIPCEQVYPRRRRIEYPNKKILAVVDCTPRRQPDSFFQQKTEEGHVFNEIASGKTPRLKPHSVEPFETVALHPLGCLGLAAADY